VNLNLAILYMSVTAFFCLLVPGILALVLILRRKASWRTFVLGIAAFTVSQLLLRIPLLNLLQNSAGYMLFAITNPVLFSVLLALSAGVFEEGGRYLIIRKLLKRPTLHWHEGIVFGLGHGGVEAFWLVGLGYVSLIAAALRGQNLSAILAVPPHSFLLAGVERLLAVILHIALSLLVFYSVRYRRVGAVIIAVIAHTVVNAVVLVIQQSGIPITGWQLEGILAVLVLPALAYIILVRQRLPAESQKKEEVNPDET